MTKNDALPFPSLLVIDCAERQHTAVGLLRTGQESLVDERDVQAQNLPKMIEELLGRAKILPANLKGIALVKRSGSVTAVRIGTVTANTLAWLQRLPILEVEAESLSAAIKLLQAGKYTAAVKNSRPAA